MLKAVRFDEEKHKELLDYIDSYRDNKGKPNNSEAIRYLMEKGFEIISNPVQLKPETITPIEISSIKDQLYTEIMEDLTKKLFSSLQVPQQFFSQQVEQKVEKAEKVETIEKPKLTPPPKPVPSPPRIDSSGGLLANLLGNANR